ncbi:hypothetical protein Bbelb_317580 [Branchiostoma belcheri]|nr:hypothetical protein Bbelb_317580 [Branchiostoma belcheri]
MSQMLRRFALQFDLFTFQQREYLITVDYYSNYFEIDRCENTRAATVVKKLKAQFARHGIPDVVISDNGPQFTAEEFEKFAREWNFKHQPSSPGYPQSNGKAENAVKTAKQLMEKAFRGKTDPYLALLDLRNMPTQGVGSSPAQRLFNRRTNTTVRRALLEPEVPSEIPRKLQNEKERQRKYYNRQARDLPNLQVGDTVRCQPLTPAIKYWKQGTVVAELEKRSYEVQTEDGGRYRRNRRHLRHTRQMAPNMDDVLKGLLPQRSNVGYTDVFRKTMYCHSPIPRSI